MIRVGLLGTGSRGRLLARCIALCEEQGEAAAVADVRWQARVVAAADPAEYSRQQARDVLPEDCPIAPHADAVIHNPSVDVVVVATPSVLHADLAVAALEAGKDVICEKPMTTTLADADRIVEAVQRTGRIFGLSMQNRYSFWARRVLALRDGGKLGQLKMMWCHEFRKPFVKRPYSDNWISRMEPSGGPFLEKNSHHWDIFDMWANAPALRVYARTGDTGSHNAQGDIWDCAWANVEYANGVMASHGLSLMTPHGHRLTMGVIGTQGWVETERTADGGTVRYHRSDTPEADVTSAALAGTGAIGHAGAEIPMLNHLFRSIEHGVQPETNAWWGRESILIGLAAQRAADQTRAVEIGELRAESRFPQGMPDYGTSTLPKSPLDQSGR